MASSNETKPIIIYTDGACLGNPGPGGWGATLSNGTRKKELWGGVPGPTTSSRMELTAAIKALQALKRPLSVRLHSDSTYLVHGATKWRKDWKRRDWRKRSGKPVANADLWQEIDRLIDIHRIEWVWVKGHAGDPGNERADALANRAIPSSASL